MSENTRKPSPDADGGEASKEAEPERMSWFVFVFMGLCLLMTAALAYYAWNVFERAV